MFNTIDKTIYSADEIAAGVRNTIEYYQNKCDWLLEKNKELLEQAKEYIYNQLKEENKALKRRLALSYGEFASYKEKEAYEDFERRHMHNRETSKFNSGRAPYLIPIGTGIGTILHVKCPICGEEEDITDSEAW